MQANLSPIRSAHRTPITLVLDTNVVLDWLVFCDPSVSPLGQAIVDGDAHWLLEAAMKTELERVLTYPQISRLCGDAQFVWSIWERHGRIVPSAQDTAGTMAFAAKELRCADPDDQKFLDLALRVRADFLISRDRALLCLDRHTRSLGLRILTPRAWAQAHRTTCP